LSIYRRESHDNLAAIGTVMASWLIGGDLPPVGNRILLKRGNVPPLFNGYRSHWVNSGTAALSLALMIARKRRLDVQKPAVVIPAYGCPDLVAAALFAGVTPLLADIDPNDPGYSLDSFAKALTPDTVAVVAVNFLGIRERLGDLQKMISANTDALLIEDNAQWFPEPMNGKELIADLACLSFGRGKPVSLLGGGALLIREGSGLEVPPDVVGGPQGPGIAFVPKVIAYNALLHRYLYWLVNRNPLFSLGRTILKPLADIRSLDATRLQFVGACANNYLAQKRSLENDLAEALGAFRSLGALAVNAERWGRLLRYPVLCKDEQTRDATLAKLNAAGLGATAMYRLPLVEIAGVAEKVRLLGDCRGAKAFASRLLTLPVHQSVTKRDIAKLTRILTP
jgi:dTDP-4-amino-4,6-dideoxygalactose transaminase